MAAASLSACKGSDKDATGAAAKAEASPILVTLALDGESLPGLTKESLQRTPLLKDIVPSDASWKMVRAISTPGATLHLKDPAKTYPGKELRVYLDAEERPSIGLFTIGDASAPSSLRLANIRSLEVFVGAIPDPDAKPILDVVVSGKVHRWSRHTLEGLPVFKVAGAGKRNRGANFSAWLDKNAPAFSSITVHSRGARALVLTSQDLREPGHTAVIKRSRQGQIRFRLMRSDNEGVDRVEFRNDVHRIEVQ